MNTKKENGIFTAVITLLFATILMAALPTEAEAMIYEDTLRLHILAASDKEDDQEIKLAIRDKILEKYGARLKECKNLDEAEDLASKLICEIKSDVDLWLLELGTDDTASVTLTREWYDTREYEDFTLPKGYYNSLQVIIGVGNGRNWWCVMYPPLCLELATERTPPDDSIYGYTEEETRLISGKKYNIKFKILEIVADAFSKNS